MDYGDISLCGVVERLKNAREATRLLDSLIWLHVGCDYPLERWQASPLHPAHPVNGRTMAKAMELGLHGVESAFCVPQLTSDIGAAYKITSLWFPRALVDLRSGGGATHHIAMLVDRAAGCHAAISNVSGAAALSEALIRASAFVDRDAIPALRPSG